MPFVKLWILQQLEEVSPVCFCVLQGVSQLAVCLSEEPEDHIKAATVWSIGQIGQHTPDHAKAVATANLLPKILKLYTDASSSEDLQAKVRNAAHLSDVSLSQRIKRAM